MTLRQPRYSKEEFAQRGNKIYESQLRQQVETGLAISYVMKLNGVT